MHLQAHCLGFLQMSRSRTTQCFCAIDTTAFSLVMVVLLLGIYIFGSAATPGFHAYSSWQRLPRTPHASAQPDFTNRDATVITVRRDGEFFLGNEEVALEQISSRLREQQSVSSGKSKVYLKVDENARYCLVKQVIDAVHSAGVQRITVLTRPPTL